MIEVRDSLREMGSTTEDAIVVKIDHRVIGLLSDQLYQSPLKAVEELVVNSYDAGADECRVFIPEPSDARLFVAVFDNGEGMNESDLTDLWRIGGSTKRSPEVEARSKRKQIGKFGIGKLATRAIARHLTHIAKKDGVVRLVTVDYEELEDPKTDEHGVAITDFGDGTELKNAPAFVEICESLGVGADRLVGGESLKSWTLAILEELKKEEIHLGRLRWVLSTAMPLQADFKLFLNKREIVSSKDAFTVRVRFSVADLDDRRFESLRREAPHEEWSVQGTALKSMSFPTGITGEVMVTEKSLVAGKSADIRRSHGYFIRVRGRLINEEDALFGLSPRSHATWNRFRADLDVDDLDVAIRAPREGASGEPQRSALEPLLRHLFSEARERLEAELGKDEERRRRANESKREWVSPRLVEHPIADAISDPDLITSGADADAGWFYLDVKDGEGFEELASRLYAGQRERYSFRYQPSGRGSRLAKFDPKEAVFWINEDHELAREFFDDARSKRLLETVVAAEALLEVYLIEHGIHPALAGDILERRDQLMRSLTQDRAYSLRALAQELRDAQTDDNELEIALVASARALGFIARHIGGAGEPDGVARYGAYREDDTVITLEAKSSSQIPSLASIDFAGLERHRNDKRYGASGCLLVAPAYPGAGRGEESAVSTSATASKISCWTVEDLARVVESAETRHITAPDIRRIVETKFAPEDVAHAVGDLLSKPRWDRRTLYLAILDAVEFSRQRVLDGPPDVSSIQTLLVEQEGFAGIKREQLQTALRELAEASRGGLVFREREVLLQTSVEELRRRVDALSTAEAAPRRHGAFFHEARTEAND